MPLLYSIKHYLICTLVATPLPSSPATQTQLFASPKGMLFHKFLCNKNPKMYAKRYWYILLGTLFKSLFFFFEQWLQKDQRKSPLPRDQWPLLWKVKWHDIFNSRSSFELALVLKINHLCFNVKLLFQSLLFKQNIA